MIIRKEITIDAEAIFWVTKAAFENHPHSQQTEQFIVNALRAAGALTLSLVAEVGGKVVGHIAFSPVTVSSGDRHWYGLGPISVLPEHQRQGIGKALIGEGLRSLKASGARGCVLVGDPNYYQQLGFRNFPEFVYEGIPQEYVHALSFTAEQPRGIVVFHEGFSAKS